MARGPCAMPGKNFRWLKIGQRVEREEQIAVRGRLRVGRECDTEMRQGFVGAGGEFEEAPQIIVRRRIAGSQAQRFFKGDASLSKFSPCEQGVAEDIMRLRPGGFDLDRASEDGDRFIESRIFKERGSEIEPNGGVVRSKTDGLAKMNDRLGIAPECAECAGQIGVQHGRLRLSTDRPGKKLCRGEGIALLAADEPEKVERIRMVRCSLQNLPIEQRSAGEFAGAVKLKRFRQYLGAAAHGGGETGMMKT